jgi:hypothetical protein
MGSPTWCTGGAFQQAVTRVSGIDIPWDGDLVMHGSRRIGATEIAVRSMSAQLQMDDKQIRRGLLKGRRADFDRAQLWQRTFELADRLGTTDRAWYARLPAIAWLITAPTFAAGLMVQDLRLAWLLLLIPNALNILWLGPVVTAVQHLVSRPLRATASASFLLINNLVGLGVGPTLIGALSELFKERFGTEALLYAAVSVLGFYLLAALLMFFAVKRLRTDWVDDPEPAST